MDIEKLIEQLRARGLSNGSSLGYHSGLFDEAATALSTLQAENAEMQKQLNEFSEFLCHVIKEMNSENEKLRAKLDAAIKQLHGNCTACKHFTPKHNEGPCRTCKHEYYHLLNNESLDNWEWRDPHKED